MIYYREFLKKLAERLKKKVININFKNLKKDLDYKTYDIEKYFEKNDERSKYIITKIFENRNNRKIFFILNDNEEVEIFIKTIKKVEIPDDSLINIDFSTYYEGVVHSELKIFHKKTLIDVRKYSFVFNDFMEDNDLIYLINMIEKSKIIFNYYLIEDNEINIYRRFSSLLTENEINNLKSGISNCIENGFKDIRNSDLIYSKDLEFKQFKNNFFFYKYEEQNDLIDIELIKSKVPDKIDLIIASVVDEENNNYIATNININNYLNMEQDYEFKSRLINHFFNIDYATVNNSLYPVYNDVKTNVDLKFSAYQNYNYDVLYYRDRAQKNNILIDNNYYDYLILKKAFLYESYDKKKLFYAINLLDFLYIDEFESIMEFIINQNLRKYHSKYIAKKISSDLNSRYEKLLNNIDDSDEKINYNLKNISRYVYFYNRMSKMVFLIDRYSIEEIENFEEMIINSLIEFNKDFLKILISFDTEKIKEIFKIINKENLKYYRNRLREKEGYSEEKLELKMMDLKQAFMDMLSVVEEDEVAEIFEEKIKDIYF
ncbi:MAG: hypothetical protein FXF47_05290 [Candidatus Mcinerneyibacterium aminivorans]|uniref:Uncharacterized protein n=1 Tax=Candidatus Mcinerneyibacterium aminivorans TaxID=2703815 RepID=A0A5D0ML22_9BACT|nr:MAG: hypothetical protein FXF47_05290 [Candidatus Mcinerneyibacterium aminivorans]